jgi:hypothetical protein
MNRPDGLFGKGLCGGQRGQAQRGLYLQSVTADVATLNFALPSRDPVRPTMTR